MLKLIITLFLCCFATNVYAATESCQGKCGQKLSQCSCEAGCVLYCCDDYEDLCIDKSTLNTCEGKCGTYYSGTKASCHCGPECKMLGLGPCCDDYMELCEIPLYTCKGKCGATTVGKCSCSSDCKMYKTCCYDYEDLCDAPDVQSVAESESDTAQEIAESDTTQYETESDTTQYETEGDTTQYDTTQYDTESDTTQNDTAHGSDAGSDDGANTIFVKSDVVCGNGNVYYNPIPKSGGCTAGSRRNGYAWIVVLLLSIVAMRRNRYAKAR